MESEQQIQKRNLNILVKHGGFQFTDDFFPYTSGEIGPYYVQSAVVMKNGRDYWRATQDFSHLILNKTQTNPHRGSNFDVISSGETRDWIFSFPLVGTFSIPHAMLYKNGKILGSDMKDKRVIHVADLNNEGSSPRDYWVPMIKKAGGEISDIFFYVDRMEDGVQIMKDLGLNSHAVVSLDEHAWDYLQKQGVVSAEVYKSLSTPRPRSRTRRPRRPRRTAPTIRRRPRHPRPNPMKRPHPRRNPSPNRTPPRKPPCAPERSSRRRAT